MVLLVASMTMADSGTAGSSAVGPTQEIVPSLITRPASARSVNSDISLPRRGWPLDDDVTSWAAFLMTRMEDVIRPPFWKPEARGRIFSLAGASVSLLTCNDLIIPQIANRGLEFRH